MSDTEELRPRRSLSNLSGPIEARGDQAFRFPLVAAMQAQVDAESGEGDLPGRDSLTHGFHAYPAKMHPALARVLLEQFLLGPTSEVLDPFCGSGTVAIEAMVSGWRCLSSDLDPLALRLARVKTERRSVRQRERFLELLEIVGDASTQRVRDRAPVRATISAEERSWYEVHVLKEMAGLLEEIRKVSDKRDRRALEMVFSSLVVKFSRQRSETAERPMDKRIRKGLVSEFFVRKGSELVERWTALSEVLPSKSNEPRFVLSDARRLPETLSGDYRCDLILTSPPYGGTYDYAQHHTRRHAWLGLNAKHLRQGEIGARRELSGGRGAENQGRADNHGAGNRGAGNRGAGNRGAGAGNQGTGPGNRSVWDDQLRSTLIAMRALLRKEAVVVLLIGDAEIGGQRVPADRQLERLAPEVELEFLAVATQPREDWRGGEPRNEHLVALRRVD